MRRLSEVTAPILPAGLSVRSCARRPLKSFAGNLTTLVLIQHGSSDKALFVSDNNDSIGAVWVPRALLQIDKADRGKFLVATMSLAFAQQKRLTSRFIDPSKLLPEEASQLADAVGTAARSRNALRGYRQPMGWSGGRNVFA
jgi:hypothetical protein